MKTAHSRNCAGPKGRRTPREEQKRKSLALVSGGACVPTGFRGAGKGGKG